MQLKQAKRRVPVHVSREGGKSQITAVMWNVTRHSLFIGTLHPFPIGSHIEIRPTDRRRTFSTKGIVVNRSVAPKQRTNHHLPGMRVKVLLSEELERELEQDRRPMRRADLNGSAIAFVGRQRHAMEFRNISTTGAALTGKSELEVTELVLLTFILPGVSRGLSLNGIVVRREQMNESALVAVEFIDPPKDTVDAIDRYVRESTS